MSRPPPDAWAHVLESHDVVYVWVGGSMRAWAKRELRNIATVNDVPLEDRRRACVIIPNNAINREAIARVLWKCLGIRYHDAQALFREFLGEGNTHPEDDGDPEP